MQNPKYTDRVLPEWLDRQQKFEHPSTPGLQYVILHGRYYLITGEINEVSGQSLLILSGAKSTHLFHPVGEY